MDNSSDVVLNSQQYDPSYRALVDEGPTQGLGFKVWVFGSRAWGPGFWGICQALGFTVEGPFVFRVEDSTCG